MAWVSRSATTVAVTSSMVASCTQRRRRRRNDSLETGGVQPLLVVAGEQGGVQPPQLGAEPAHLR
jgi:hypothetical protein